MQIYCITSNDYADLVPEFAERFNRFWINAPPADVQKVTVLCYDRKPSKLPGNFDVVSLGKQTAFGEAWTDGLIPYFGGDNVPNLFIVMLEDYHIVKPVNAAAISFLALRFRDSQVAKIGLTNDAIQYPHEKTGTPGLLLQSQDARYRGSSLQAAIWRKSYFRNLLVPGRTAWDFELKGEKECAFDGTAQYFVRDSVIRYENKMNKGMPI